MIEIVPVTMRNVEAFREVRLRALREDPSAFGSTYAREVAFTDAEWAARVERWNGKRGVGFLAIDRGHVACGMAGALLEEDGQIYLVSMWTATDYRRRGVGQKLVEAVSSWAAELGSPTVRLMVTSCNDVAIRFYERLGFERTGKVGPHPNNPAIVEYEMARPVG